MVSYFAPLCDVPSSKNNASRVLSSSFLPPMSCLQCFAISDRHFLQCITLEEILQKIKYRFNKQALYCSHVKNELVNMTRAWNKESPFRQESNSVVTSTNWSSRFMIWLPIASSRPIYIILKTCKNVFEFYYDWPWLTSLDIFIIPVFQLEQTEKVIIEFPWLDTSYNPLIPPNQRLNGPP